MTKENKALKMIVCSYLRGTYSLDFDINEIDFEKLYKLSNALNVSSVVGVVLRKNNINNKNFENSLLKAMSHYEVMNDTYNKISNEFEKEQIDFIQLKGSTISKYYDYPFARYCSDIDIMVKEKDYKKAYNLLINSLHCKCYSHSVHEDGFISRNEVNIDLHKSFIFENKKYNDVLLNCEVYNHELDDNYKYYHLIAHEVQHIKRGELNYRFFIDLYYLRQNIDEGKVAKLIHNGNLDKINKTLNSYLDSILNNNNNQITKEVDEFILSYAGDQGVNNRISISDNNKIFFFITNLFPSPKLMKGKYPVLNQYPIIFPYCYCHRIFKLAFGQRNKYTFKTIKAFFNRKDIDVCLGKELFG